MLAFLGALVAFLGGLLSDMFFNVLGVGACGRVGPMGLKIAQDQTFYLVP